MRVAAIEGGIRMFAMILALVSVAQAESAADSAFEKIAAAFVDDLPALSAVNATQVGDHRADAVLDQVGSAGRTGVSKIYERHLAGLQTINRLSLSRPNQVDADLLMNEIESQLWQIETLQEWAWNPLVYVQISGNAIYALMARDFAPLPQRLDSATKRLEQLPRFLAQARASLQPQRVPKIHAETAIKQNPGLNSTIETMITPHLNSASGEFKFRLQAAIATAKTAIAEHQAWLEEELLPRAAGNFRLGRSDSAGRTFSLHTFAFMFANSSSTMPSSGGPSIRSGLSIPITKSSPPCHSGIVNVVSSGGPRFASGGTIRLRSFQKIAFA